MNMVFHFNFNNTLLCVTLSRTGSFFLLWFYVFLFVSNVGPGWVYSGITSGSDTSLQLGKAILLTGVRSNKPFYKQTSYLNSAHINDVKTQLLADPITNTWYQSPSHLNSSESFCFTVSIIVILKTQLCFPRADICSVCSAFTQGI